MEVIADVRGQTDCKLRLVLHLVVLLLKEGMTYSD